jgi:hypothetical protein
MRSADLEDRAIRTIRTIPPTCGGDEHPVEIRA